MTVDDLRRLLDDPRIDGDTEIRIGYKQIEDEDIEDYDTGCLDASIGTQTGRKRAMVLEPEEDLLLLSDVQRMEIRS
jgi:hypothetical protein